MGAMRGLTGTIPALVHQRINAIGVPPVLQQRMDRSRRYSHGLRLLQLCHLIILTQHPVKAFDLLVDLFQDLCTLRL
jgi:hypothetical protein